MRIIAELDASRQLVRRYIYETHVNVPDYMDYYGDRYVFIKDPRGSVLKVVRSENGLTYQDITYDDWGGVISDTNPGFQPFGFAGGLYDKDTKLVRFGARDYDAETGRWLSKDPIGFDGGDTNLYGYVLQDPINFIDPNGEFPKNLDEAAECLWGNPKGLIDMLQRNIRDNNAEIASLRARMANQNQCQDTSRMEARIRSLTSVNKGLQGELDTLVNKCSYFPKGGM